jgi:hypothetical protein
VGIAVEKLPAADARKHGSQGLLDIAVASIFDADLRTHLEQKDLGAFLDIKEKFAEQIQNQGLKAKIIDEVIDMETLARETKGNQKGNGPNYQVLADRYGLDYLLLLKVNGAGVTRQYFGFIPLGAPKGYCEAKGELIKLNTNQTCWMYTMAPGSSVVPINGKWNNPPEYREIDSAVEKAVAMAMVELETNFR